MSHVTWDIKRDMWHMTHDRWGEVNFPLTFHLPSSYGLGVKVFWRFWGNGSVNQLINHKGDSRSAPATPGLLITSWKRKKINNRWGQMTIFYFKLLMCMPFELCKDNIKIFDKFHANRIFNHQNKAVTKCINFHLKEKILDNSI